MSVFSCSTRPPEPVSPGEPNERLRAIASTSSMKTIARSHERASWKSSLIRLAPTPTYISTKSEPLAEINGTPASAATARARRVLPVPGGPTRSAPRGGTAPRRSKRLGSARNDTISLRSSTASSQPAKRPKRGGGELRHPLGTTSKIDTPHERRIHP